MVGSKRASDDGQDLEPADNGHPIKKPRQESDAHAELKILIPSRVSSEHIPEKCELLLRMAGLFVKNQL